jgi:hypothetical protein
MPIVEVNAGKRSADDALIPTRCKRKEFASAGLPPMLVPNAFFSSN